MSRRKDRKSELSLGNKRRIKGSILSKNGPSPNESFASTGNESQLFCFAASNERGVDFFQAIIAADAA